MLIKSPKSHTVYTNICVTNNQSKYTIPKQKYNKYTKTNGVDLGN